MDIRLKGATALVAAAMAAAWLATIPTASQAPSAGSFSAYKAPRTADGKPNLNGIWQSFTTANWDILAHAAQPGPHPEIMGAWGAAPGGQGIVEGNEIPYQPWAAAKQKENFKNRMVVKVTNDPHRFDTGEPELQCYRPGVPRANYMPFPFQIFQTPGADPDRLRVQGRGADDLHEQQGRGAERHLDGVVEGRWEGDTLVVDVTGFDGHTWFDRAGNFHSDALHVVERYTPDQSVPPAVRSHDRRPEGLYATLEDELSHLSSRRAERSAGRVQLRAVRRRNDVHAARALQAARQVDSAQ